VPGGYAVAPAVAAGLLVDGWLADAESFGDGGEGAFAGGLVAVFEESGVGVGAFVGESVPLVCAGGGGVHGLIIAVLGGFGVGGGCGGGLAGFVCVWWVMPGGSCPHVTEHY